MGSCSAKKRVIGNGDITIIEKPKIEKKYTQNQLILEQYHKLSQLLELIGNTDNLDHKTREQINYLIIIRSNVSIIIQHEIKKVFKQRNITKQVSFEDESLLFEDTQFYQRVTLQMSKLAKQLEVLENNPEFENAFPILSHSFFQINEETKKIVIQLAETKTRNTTL